MSALKGREPADEELEEMIIKEHRQKRKQEKKSPSGIYVTAVNHWYYQTTTPRRVFDVKPEERAGGSLLCGFQNAVRRLKFEHRVRVYCFKRIRRENKDRVYLKRLK